MLVWDYDEFIVGCCCFLLYHQVCLHQGNLFTFTVDLLRKRPLHADGSLVQMADCQPRTSFTTREKSKHLKYNGS